MKLVLPTICCCALLLVQSGPAAAPSIAISPSVIMLRGAPGLSTTQTLTIVNSMSLEMRFVLEAQDVVIRDGKRVYLPAGQIPGGIALDAVVRPASVVVPAGQSASVGVTFTLPPDTRQRAVVVYFKGRPSVQKGATSFGVALGALITFNLPGDARIVAGAINATEQSANENVSLSQELENTGSEPALAKGALVILNDAGKRIAKVSIEPHRILPGERLALPVTVPTALSAGHYRVLASFEYEGQVLTNVGQFTISK